MQDLFDPADDQFGADNLASGNDATGASPRFAGRRQSCWRPLHEARTWARSQGFMSVEDFRAARSAGKIPLDIPSNPEKAYKAQGWSGWKDFLGADQTIAEMLKAAGNDPAALETIPPVRRGQKKKWRCFNEARTWARSQKFANQKAFLAASRAGLVPADIPSNPNITYAGFGWTSTEDFLGTEVKYWPFEQARAWAHAQRDAGKVMFRRDWARQRLNGAIPSEIPGNPEKAYADQGWVNWEDFLGQTDNRRSKLERLIATVLSGLTKVQEGHVRLKMANGKSKKVDVYLPDLQTVIEIDGCYWHHNTLARDEADTEGLTDAGYRVVRLREQSAKYSLPLITPSLDLAYPSSLSSNKKVSLVVGHLVELGILSPSAMGKIDDLLANGTAPRGYASAQWLPFSLAREIARSLKLSGKAAWECLAISEAFDAPAFERMPRTPWSAYEKDWISWSDWLGTNNLAPNAHVFLQYEEAKRRVQAMSPVPSTERQWRRAIKDKRIPEGVPLNPPGHYGAAMPGWGDFLGTGRRKHQRKEYAPIEVAMAWVLENLPWPRTFAIWAQAVKEGRLPEDIPRSPSDVYMRRGEWVDWKTFLGTGRRRWANREERPLPQE